MAGKDQEIRKVREQMRLLQHDIGKFKRVDRLGLEEVNDRLKKAERDRDYFKEKALSFK